EAYWNRLETQPTIYSDGAVATVVHRDHRRLRWLATELQTDGRYVDFYKLDVGGAAAPFNGWHVARSPRVRDTWSVLEAFGNELEPFEAFMLDLDDRAKAVLEAACDRSHTLIAELSKVILVGDNIRAMTSLSNRLAVPPSITNIELVQGYGHLGAADYLFALSHYSDCHELVKGTRVALVGRGAGVHWGCTVLEV